MYICLYIHIYISWKDYMRRKLRNYYRVLANLVVRWSQVSIFYFQVSIDHPKCTLNISIKLVQLFTRALIFVNKTLTSTDIYACPTTSEKLICMSMYFTMLIRMSMCFTMLIRMSIYFTKANMHMHLLHNANTHVHLLHKS